MIALYLIGSAAMWLGFGYVMVAGVVLRRTVQAPEERPISIGVRRSHSDRPGPNRTPRYPRAFKTLKQKEKVDKAMTPIWMFEGTKKLDPVSQRNLAERRFSALAAAVRQHEAATKREVPGVRPEDAALYRKLRQICGQATEVEEVA